MHAQKLPTAVRLLGFSADAAAHLASLLAQAPRSGPLYACLHEDSLQVPDIVIADGHNEAVLAQLDCMRTTPPGLVIGGDRRQGCAHLDSLDEPALLYDTLARLLADRRRALSLLSARGEPLLAERRRSPRLPGTQDGIARRGPPREGKVLIVDKGGAFRDHLADLVGGRQPAIAWTDSASMAVRLCDETPVTLAMINTSTPGIDPYLLSRRIKAQAGAQRTAVVLLVGRTFTYDGTLARDAGVRGLLDKPVGDRSLVATLQRLAGMAERRA